MQKSRSHRNIEFRSLTQANWEDIISWCCKTSPIKLTRKSHKQIQHAASSGFRKSIVFLSFRWFWLILLRLEILGSDFNILGFGVIWENLRCWLFTSVLYVFVVRCFVFFIDFENSDEILSRRFVWLCVFCTDVVVLCFFRIFVGFQLIIMDLGVIVSSVFGIFPNWCFPHIM